MLNGKFFTGLTPKMIESRTPRPDRFKSNFFWPDESDESPASSPSPSKARSRANTTQNDQRISTNKEEITPKNLYHKQLKSKIEFYDTVDSSPDNKRSPFIEKKNKEPNKERLNNSRSDMYEEKDSFYKTTPKKNDRFYKSIDEESFEEEKLPQTPQHTTKETNNYKQHQAKEFIIKIDQEQTDQTTVVSDMISKKKLIPNRNISKSVENISKTREIDNLIKNVNKIKMEKERTKLIEPIIQQQHDEEEFGYDHSELTKGKMNNNRLVENNYTERHQQIRQSANKTINNSNSHYELNDIDIDLRCEPTLNMSNKKNNYNSHDAIEKSHNINVYQTKQNNNIVDEHNEFVHNNDANDHGDRYDDHQYGQRRSYGTASIKNASSRGHQYQPTTRLAANEPTNEARTRVHNNLKSNIFFNDC